MEFNDVAEMKLSTDTINSLPIGVCLKSIERPIAGSKCLRWAFHITRDDVTFRTDLWVSSAASVLHASGYIVVGPAKKSDFGFYEKFGRGPNVKKICGGFYCDRLGVNGSVTVHVRFTFYDEKPDLPALTINDFIKSSNHYECDARIVVGVDALDVHRHVLRMASPVFHAAFTHDTTEARSGTINIKDFDFATVKNAVDVCYGRECTAGSLAEYVDMLRFADKYDIRSIIELVEPCINDRLTSDSFCVVANYAWDLEKTDLKLKCAKFYKDNVAQLASMPEFMTMNPSTIDDIIRMADSADSQK